MIRKLLSVIVAVLFMAACSTTNHQAGTPLEQWGSFATKQTPIEVPKNRVGVVFLREQGRFNAPGVNIFVNGHYLTSLLDNGYKTVYLCSFKQRLSSSFTSKNDNYNEKYRGKYYTFNPNSVVYVKVNQNASKPELIQISNVDGEKMLADMRQQNHTLSRVDEVNACPDVVIKQFTLKADALFKFDKSDYANMLEQGKKDIAVIRKEIHKYDSKINRISIIGYTDPEGDAKYNLKLSQKRADTVKDVLLSSNSKYRDVISEGRGKQELLVTGCRAKHPKNAVARVACDQPNRRVEILLYGAREEAVNAK